MGIVELTIWEASAGLAFSRLNERIMSLPLTSDVGAVDSTTYWGSVDIATNPSRVEV